MYRNTICYSYWRVLDLDLDEYGCVRDRATIEWEVFPDDYGVLTVHLDIDACDTKQTESEGDITHGRCKAVQQR